MTGSERVGSERAVLCLSGGMDSCVCAALAAREYEVYALHFSYGQRTEARELESAKAVARLTGAKEFLPLTDGPVPEDWGVGADGRDDCRAGGAGGCRRGDRGGGAGDVCAVSECAFSGGGGELGGGDRGAAGC